MIHWYELLTSLAFLLPVAGQSNLLCHQSPDRPLPARWEAPSNPTQLVAQAHRALALWEGFPGFVADLEVSIAGKPAHGRIIVEPTGQIFTEHLSSPDASWVKTRLACLIHQQLRQGEVVGKEWKFIADDCEPFGQELAVVRVDRPLDRRLWICNRQLAAIETRSCQSKTTTTFLTFQTATEGKALPGVVAVHVWNARTDELKTTEIQARTWKQVRGFNLPATVEILSVEATAVTPRPVRCGIKLSNHRLLLSANPLLADK
jgi:hypothetical protein